MKTKKIVIQGSQNIKSISGDKTRERVKQMTIDDAIFENHKQQHSFMCSLYVTDKCLHKTEILSELQKKLQGYIQQDKQHGFYDENSIMKTHDIIELLVTSKLQCSYCKKAIYVLYKNVRQPDQWTLDRIDNTQGHNVGNCVASCYKCNVQKKQMDDTKFRFTKQMKIIKQGC